MFKTLLASVALSLSFATSGLAAIVTSNTQDNTELGTLTGTTLNLGSATWSTAPDIRAGNLGGQYRSPFEQLGAGNFERLSYWNVLGGTSATLSVNGPASALSFLWGSVDTYNFVTLINSVTNQTDVIDLADLLFPDVPPTGIGASFVTIRSGFAFDKVQFLSQGNSLEFSNVSVAPVPLPAGGVLLVTALGGFGLLRRRKQAAA